MEGNQNHAVVSDLIGKGHGNMKRLVIGIGMTLAALSLSGCREKSTPITPALMAAPAHTATPSLIIAIDRSGSTSAMRETMINVVHQCASSAAENEAPLDLWAYDKTALCFWGPQIPESADATDDALSKEVSTVDAAQHRMTRPALLIEGWLADPHLKQMASPRFVLLTDGDSEYADDTPRLAKALHALGNISGAHLYVIGIKPQNRQMWDKMLSPAFGDRYQLASLDSDAEAQAVLEKMLDAAS